MLKNSTNYINLVSILILIYLAFIPLKPHDIKIDSVIEGRFSVQNSIDHVKNISDLPHYSGSLNQRRVKSYIIRELKAMGLDVVTQKTNISNQFNTFVQAENIIAKIKGSDISEDAQSLVVMSHYDSAPYSSHGASDAGSGVAVILEGIRAYLTQKIQPKNDIIILITDAEEIGLLGAQAFVTKHPWANKVGAVLNFEARGTAGSSYMFMETNQGNGGLLDAFNKSGVQLAQSNSLAYSIYKMMPNDTDLSVFRKKRDIVGYNFAFIDNHFNYHTALDNKENLSLNSLAHQALYLMPMLNKLSQIDLSTLHSEKNDIYFQVPFWKTVSYPFDWALSMTLVILVLFVLIVGMGLKRNKLRLKSVMTGGLPLLKSLIISALVSFSVLKFLYWLHPHYSEILQGFTYNGYIYIAFFNLLTLSICFFFYRRVIDTHTASELMVLPILLWIIITLVFSASLTGAHYLILIPIFGTIALTFNIFSSKPQGTLTLLMFAPIILIFTPLIALLPVALGLMSLPFSGLLVTLIFSVFVSCISILKQYQINKWVFIIPLVSVYIFAETQASFNQKRPIPNSLYYLQDDTSNSAYLFSNDNKMDDWTIDFLNKDTLNEKDLIDFRNNHWRWAKIAARSEHKHIPIAQIDIVIDRNYTDKHIYKLKITPQRMINRMNLIVNTEVNLLKLAINREVLYDGETKVIKKNGRLATIYQKSELSFTLDIELAPGETLDFNLIEMSPDLLQSRHFDIPLRPKEYIPKPFIYSDSIITKQKISL